MVVSTVYITTTGWKNALDLCVVGECYVYSPHEHLAPMEVCIREYQIP